MRESACNHDSPEPCLDRSLSAVASTLSDCRDEGVMDGVAALLDRVGDRCRHADKTAEPRLVQLLARLQRRYSAHAPLITIRCTEASFSLDSLDARLAFGTGSSSARLKALPRLAREGGAPPGNGSNPSRAPGHRHPIQEVPRRSARIAAVPRWCS